jgi:predicted GIY-YIG superfamily endonuclease
MEEKWYCYILRSTNEEFKNYTYNGSTNDPWRRLRQHNGEICGGAKATKNKGPWEFYFLMTGFKTHRNALSCEWMIKHPTKKRIRPKKYCGIEGRIKGLNEILCLDKWTSKCELNNDCEYTIYIISEMIDHIDKTILPNNINIIVFDTINKENFIY